MGGITSGIGIFSGINSGQLIDQLIAIESRPKQLAQARIIQLQQQRAAYLDVNSALLALKTAAGKFSSSKVFRTAAATSSNTGVLTASASTSASPGSYQLSVKRLVSTQQSLSRGFTDKDNAGVGLTSITFENGRGAIDSETRLSELNGGQGVVRGKIQLKDATGATAVVDLSTAVTVSEVIDAINSAAGVSVSAKIDGRRLVLTDTSGVSGTLSVTDVFGSTTATSLGLAKTSASGVGQSLTGDNIRTLSGATALTTLNDGNGVLIRDGGGVDFTIRDRDGTLHNIILGERTQTTTDPDTNEPVTTVIQTRATTLQEVIAAINSQTDGKVTAALNADKTGLVLSDSTGGSGNLTVANGLNGRTTATDLGIEGDVAASSLQGKQLLAGINSTLIRNLKGGAGLNAGSFSVTDRDGNSTTLLIANSDLTGSVSDLVGLLNQRLADNGVQATLSLNRSGNGMSISDTSSGAGNLTVTGTLATALGLNDASGGEKQGANLQTQWLTRATTLASLNGGKGVGTGTIRVTTADGSSRTIDIGSSQKTVDELINHLTGFGGLDIVAEINANGDGIVIRDTSGGGGTLRIEDVTGTTGKALNLIGEADADDGLEINGSFERTLTFKATDSLQKITDTINSSGVGVSAAIIRDGGATAPFRLSLTARQSGSVGRTIVDTGAFDLGLNTLSKGEDAVAFFGAADPAKAVLLTSSTNSLTNVISGVTIDLKSTSTQPVELVVSRDTAAIETAVTEFVTAYNHVLDRITRYSRYDQDTNVRGVLFGDGTVSQLRTNLSSIAQAAPDGVEGSYQRLFEVGVRVGAGGKLELDSEKFRAALDADPANIENLFAARTLLPKDTTVDLGNGITANNPDATDQFSALGVAEKIARFSDLFTNTADGTLTRRNRTLDSQITLQQGRIGAFDQRLAAKRARLEAQFASMERAIASLQQQQSALGGIQAIR